jgi:hypothetical protein
MVNCEVKSIVTCPGFSRADSQKQEIKIKNMLIPVTVDLYNIMLQESVHI